MSTRTRTNKRPIARRNRCLMEAVEPRLLMAGHVEDVGTLNGRVFRQATVLGSDTDSYTFEVPRAGTIDIQLSRQIGTGTMRLLDSNGDEIDSAPASTRDRRITFGATSAGEFTVEVQADQEQFAPAVAYTLAIATDFAPGFRFDNSLDIKTSSFRNLGTLSESSARTARDFIGFLDTNNHAAADTLDVYKFVVPAAGATVVQLSGISDSDPADAFAKVDALLTVFRDVDNDGRLEASENQGSLLVPATRSFHFSQLPPGTYFVAVTGSRVNNGQNVSAAGTNATLGGTNYKLDITYTQHDLAGDTLFDATSVTLGNSTITRRDLLDANDTVDTFRFELTDKGPFNFDAQLNIDDPSAANFSIDLVRDTNNDGEAEPVRGNRLNNPPARSLLPPSSHIAQTLTDPGTYFLRVKRISGESGYTITMKAPSADKVGNTIFLARNLGLLTTERTFSDFVGAIDSADIFRVSVTQIGEMRVNVTNVDSGDVTIDIIRDANQDGKIASSEIVATRSIGHVLDGVVLPETGAYFVRVRPGPNGHNANYRLAVSLSAQSPFNNTPITIGNAGETRIEAENFDNGGEGIAFHDTDPADGPDNGVDFRSDTGVDFRFTNDPLGGAFRLATTKAGEFLEYTVKVQQAGTFNFDFRVSSPGDGAQFHLEVDGDDVTGPVVIPNTGGVDNMTTIPSSGGPVGLAAGPHVFRIAFDRTTGGGNGNPDIAGTMNFFTVRRV